MILPPMDLMTAASVPPDTHTSQPARPSRGKRIRKFFVRIWLLLGVGFLVYLYYSYRATGFDSAILTSDAQIAVTDASDAITFVPVGHAKLASLIFIPGAMVEPTAYAPLARSVADNGYTAIVLKLPLRMASSESQRQSAVSHVTDIIESGDPSTKWIVAGHSVGGVLACRVARDHPDLLDGLVLIGTSHPRDFDLSHLSIDVTKVFASNDGLAAPAEVRANAKGLPTQTRWIKIEGGNHSQFGYYGFQLGDHRATISRVEQQSATRQALLDALGRAESANGR